MTRLQWFNEGYGLEGVHLGIVRPDIYMKFIRYKVFMELAATNDKPTAITLTAERNRCTERTIYNAITFFEKHISK